MIAIIEESYSDDESCRDEGGDNEGDDEIGDFECYREVAEDFNQEHGFISIIQSVSATDTQIQYNKHKFDLWYPEVKSLLKSHVD